jgi:hypothetical protein
MHVPSFQNNTTATHQNAKVNKAYDYKLFICGTTQKWLILMLACPGVINLCAWYPGTAK